MARASVVIVGGGISGLSAAWALTGGADGPTASTPRVEIIEAGGRMGGALVTTPFAGRTIDLGADGFLGRRPEAVTLAKELGLQDQLRPISASGAFIWLNGVLDELPTGLVLGVPTSAKSLKGLKGLPRSARFQAWRDEHWPRRLTVGDDATIGEVLRAKLGGVLTYQLVEPMIGGIQAGRVDQLSARSVFPALLDAARQKGSLMKNLKASGPATPGPATQRILGPAFYTLADGVGSLADVLTEQLAARGVFLRTGVAVTALRQTPSSAYPWAVDTADTTTPANVVILATSALVTASLSAEFSPDLAALRSIDSAAAAMITLQLRASEVTLPPTGTGILVPLGSSFGDGDLFMTTAVTLLDRKWPHLHRDDDVLVRVHVGRIDDRRAAVLSDEQLTKRVTEELRTLLGHLGEPLAARVQRWPTGLPQYYVGHDDVVRKAKQAAQRLELDLCGNAYDGVGIPASIGSGRDAGERVLALLGEG